MAKPPQSQPPQIKTIEFNGLRYIPAAEVAKLYGVKTGPVNQAAGRKSFEAADRYKLTDREKNKLIASGQLQKWPGRGGSVSPWLFTQRGALKLAGVLQSDRAAWAAGQIVDVFMEVQAQIAAGRTAISVSNPSALAPNSAESALRTSIAEKMLDAINQLFETPITIGGEERSLGEEIGEAGLQAYQHIKERMKTRELGNEKIAAEAMLILEQANAVRERRLSDRAKSALEIKQMQAELLRQNIENARDMLDLLRKVEPSAAVDLLTAFDRPAALPPPDPDSSAR